LLNTNLTSSLLGKTFDLDDGLLTKIRVAQFQPGKSRIVLEVADGSDYRTSVLTDPPRLIIVFAARTFEGRNAGREPRKRTVTPAAEAKAQPQRPTDKRLPSRDQQWARKTVVEADDDTTAQLQALTRSSGIKPAATAGHAAPTALNLPTLSRSSNRNRPSRQRFFQMSGSLSHC